MEKVKRNKPVRYKKVSHQDYRVYVHREEYKFGNSSAAKKFYLKELKAITHE